MMNDELLKKDKTILKLHIIYWAIIFGVLSVFLLCIAPGRVDERAFENLSFASIIVSIVLAVVSIVYSFRTNSNTSDNIAGIREIEHNIDSKLDRFDSIKDSLSEDIHSAIVEGVDKAIIDLRADVSNLKDDQADIKQNISMIATYQKRLIDDNAQSSKQLHISEQKVFKSGLSFNGAIAMYMACLSFTKKKAIYFPSLGNEIESDLDYYWGYYSALSSCFPQYFAYESEGVKSFTVKKYDTEHLGEESIWEKLLLSYTNIERIDDYLRIIKSYFVGIDMIDAQGV